MESQETLCPVRAIVKDVTREMGDVIDKKSHGQEWGKVCGKPDCGAALEGEDRRGWGYEPDKE